MEGQSVRLPQLSIEMDILICEECEGLAVEKLVGKYRVVRDGELWKKAASLSGQIASARTVMIRNQTQITAELLRGATNLIAIGRVGVGLDNVDLKAATERGVVVIAPLNANATSVAELTMGLMLSLSRKIPSADRSTKARGWDRKGHTGIELEGKTLAICGFGRIGRLVGARAKAFGMKLLAFDPFVKEESPDLADVGARLCSKLEDALATADFVTAHSPLTSETRHMFAEQAFGMMKRGALFINTSRGGVVDEAALMKALSEGHLAGAALDVRESEPPSKSRFETMENVILTPHMGAWTAEAQSRTLEAVCEDLDRVLSGEAAVHFVNMARPGSR